MQDNIIVITGAARGIGLAVAQRFVHASYQVIGLDRETSADFEKLGDRARLLRCDVSDERAVGDAFSDVAKAGRIQALVNNAALAQPTKPALEKLPLEAWRKVMNTNLDGVFLCTRAAIPLFGKGGSIINIASTRALQSEPNTEAYSAAKGAMLAMTRALAISLGPHVRVNAVSPGWIATSDEALSDADHEQHPVGRVGRPADVADAVWFLVSEQASFITAHNLIVDGGMTRKMIYVE